MKSIAITAANKAAIEAALHGVNHKATAHAYTTFREVEEEAEYAEKKVLALVGSKKVAVGAKLWTSSGGAVPNAYKYNRTGTVLELVRKTGGWYLVGVGATTLYKDGGKRSITLTVEQSDKAKADFAKQWHVAPVAAVNA